ncbi:MAG: TetR/AcrR family transcriptional regulator [Candidatus Eisenbacteria bacterium]|nr:TetR/AcrR family transcriptional regulator [Candidatus Eisenbacteria bacterium]
MAKKQYHHGDLRQRLLETAEKILVREGVEGLTMRHLSEKVGVSHTAPYRHFADKTLLLSSVAEKGFLRLRNRLVEAAGDRGDGAVARLERISLAYVEFAVENPSFYRLMFGTEAVTHSPPPELQAAARSAFEIGIMTLKECQEEGSIRAEDPHLLTSLAWATIHGLSTLLIDRQVRSMEAQGGAHALVVGGEGDGSEDLRGMARMAIRSLLRGMKA